jgi:hypothetical protein
MNTPIGSNNEISEPLVSAGDPVIPSRTRTRSILRKSDFTNPDSALNEENDAVSALPGKMTHTVIKEGKLVDPDSEEYEPTDQNS